MSQSPQNMTTNAIDDEIFLLESLEQKSIDQRARIAELSHERGRRIDETAAKQRAAMLKRIQSKNL